MTADDALQQLVGAEIVSVDGTRSIADSDECYDFRIVTDKGALIAYATNNEGIAMEVVRRVSALAEALVAAQAELPCALGKDADGQIGQRSYRYLTLDKLIAETRPILQKHGLTILQEPTTIARADGEGFVPALRTHVRHVSGENQEALMPLYLSEKTMQGLGAAITYARRYAWQSVLGIAAEEDTDGPAPDPTDSVPF